MADIAKINLYVKPDLKLALEKAAEADNRSLANYLETTLTEHVKTISGKRK